MNDQSSLFRHREALRLSTAAGRPAALLVGAGLLRECGVGPLADWQTLLHCVADALDVPLDAGLSNTAPTLAWDCLMARCAAKHHEAAWKCELRARAIVCGLVRDCEHALQNGASAELAGRWLTRIGQWNLKAVVNLNFTPLPLCAADSSPTTEDHVHRYMNGSTPVWCMHGSAADAAHLRLGVIRYASLMRDFEKWRGAYRGLLGDATMLDRQRPLATPGVHFVADVFESPIVIAGCGLKHAEWTLWWLLASKARNEAQHKTCASRFVTADRLNPSLRAMLSSVHCETVQVSTHADVWTAVDFMLRR